MLFAVPLLSTAISGISEFSIHFRPKQSSKSYFPLMALSVLSLSASSSFNFCITACSNVDRSLHFCIVFVLISPAFFSAFMIGIAIGSNLECSGTARVTNQFCINLVQPVVFLIAAVNAATNFYGLVLHRKQNITLQTQRFVMIKTLDNPLIIDSSSPYASNSCASRHI